MIINRLEDTEAAAVLDSIYYVVYILLGLYLALSTYICIELDFCEVLNECTIISLFHIFYLR